MVLWEIALGTAYFLGLKRTYKLALRIQRRLIAPNHPKTRQFVYRRTRSIFDVAVSFHQKVQQTDLEVGRNVGNWILRWLDRMKPSAEICAHSEKPVSRIDNVLKNTAMSSAKRVDRDSKAKLLFSASNTRLRSLPFVATMMQRMRPASMSGQYRHVYDYATLRPFSIYHRLSTSENGVFRRDIALWMTRN